MGFAERRAQRGRGRAAALWLLLAAPGGLPGRAAAEPAQAVRQELPRAAPQELEDARWRGGVLFDDRVRSALRLSSDEARARASAVSDVLLRTLVALPLLLGVLLAALHLRRRPLLAAQLLLCSTLALSLSGLAQGWVSRTVGRERPYVQECRAPVQPVECARSVAAGRVSFYSGHTAGTATGASLVWLHVAFAPRALRRAGRALRVAAALGALATGLLRILADRHYATDVLGGLAGGVAFTLLVAWALRLVPPARVPDEEEDSPAGGAPLDAKPLS
ncbi:MAG TPA: phosphatase PAP2 family protein [Aggregicoccus sp.]|nr:phosphatase PAP2 family protein [Aggregicoccus sp.]